jgi:H+/Cl- antiporter ClcA
LGLEKVGQWRKKYKLLSLTKYHQIVIIAVITSAISFYFIHMRTDYASLMTDIFSNEDLKFPSNSSWSIPFIFFQFVFKFCLTGLFFYYFFIFFYIFLNKILVISLGLPIPCGLFAPVFVTGAMFGRFYGEIFKLIFPTAGFIFYFF